MIQRRWIGYGLRAVALLCIPFVFSFFAGCMKAGPKKEDLGPEVSPNAINDALLKASSGASTDNLAVGQMLSFVTTRRIENGDTELLLGGRKVEVIDRQDTDSEKRFTLKITQAHRLNDGNFETTVSEDALWLSQENLASALARTKIMDSSTDPVEKKVTFHHLHEFDGVLDAPANIKARPGCGGLSPCEIPVHYVQFEMVIWDNDTDYQKIAIDFAFTTKTPFLPFGHDFDQLTGSLIVDCRSTYIPVDSRTVYVRDCMTLDDFVK